VELGNAQNDTVQSNTCQWPLWKATTGEVSIGFIASFGDQQHLQHHEKGPSIEIRAARGQLLSDFSVTAEIWDAKPNKNLHSQTLHPLSKFATTFTFHGSSKLMDPTIKVMLAIQGQFPIFESSQRPCDHPKDAQKVPKMQTCCRMLFCSTVQSETKSF
jgi:hypothetical protein